jgi:hypothetical protein
MTLSVAKIVQQFLFYTRVMFLKNVAQIEHKIPI